MEVMIFSACKLTAAIDNLQDLASHNRICKLKHIVSIQTTIHSIHYTKDDVSTNVTNL